MTIAAVIVELVFFPIKRFLLYKTLDQFVSVGLALPDTTHRPGPGKIRLTPPPKPNPSIFKLDRRRTESCYAINFEKVPGNPRFPIEIHANLNMNGVLNKPVLVRKSDDKDTDDYILNRIRNWKYTPYAKGPIKVTIQVRARLAIIDLSDKNFKVSAKRIANGPGLGYFIYDLRNTIEDRIEK